MELTDITVGMVNEVTDVVTDNGQRLTSRFRDAGDDMPDGKGSDRASGT